MLSAGSSKKSPRSPQSLWVNAYRGMEKAKRNVGQKFRRIGHNLVNAKKEDDDEMRTVQQLELRNSRINNAISGFKKNVSNCIKTGLVGDNPEKRKKKLEESALCNDLRDGAAELEESHSTCLHKVMQSMAGSINSLVDERVRLDIEIEKLVLLGLTPYLEQEKLMSKNREKLSNAFTDVEIAKKACEKGENSPQLQDNLDMAHQKLENQKDQSITDIYSMAAKEQEVAKVMTTFLEIQMEYHRTAVRTIENILPDIKRHIDNARPRPVFGVDLTEHLRHSRTNVAVVLEKCCAMLRVNGFDEKGVFRVSGNNAKIKRMKAAFDAGQIELDEHAYQHDPHSICSVLKSYLRELPDPLLTHALHNSWMNAAKLDGEARLVAIEQCLRQLPSTHLHNLTYLIDFLVELLQHQDVTAMNAGNLAIVFGPNLLGGDIEGNNVHGTRLVESFLRHANRLFGCPTEDDSIDTMNRSLIVDTAQSTHRRAASFNSPSMASWTQSPRARPKEKAPPPPVVRTDKLIDLGDDWTAHQQTEATRVYTTETTFVDNHLNGSITSEESYLRKPPSVESDDSFDDYKDEPLQRSDSIKPNRPPPPNARAQWDSPSNARPVSYNLAVGIDPTTGIRSVDSHSVKRPTIVSEDLVGVPDTQNRTVVAVEAPPLPPARTFKPPVPAKPKTDDKESSRL